MAATLSETASKKPPIHISEADYDRIAGMAVSVEHSRPELAKLLLEEIDRAQVYPSDELPADVVALGSEVEFLDDATGVRRRVKLVLPRDADIDAGRISILTPVGAGLIGMKVGQEISWPYPDGRPRTLKILEVVQTP